MTGHAGACPLVRELARWSGGAVSYVACQLERPRTARHDACPLVQNTGAGAGAEKTTVEVTCYARFLVHGAVHAAAEMAGSWCCFLVCMGGLKHAGMDVGGVLCSSRSTVAEAEQQGYRPCW